MNARSTSLRCVLACLAGLFAVPAWPCISCANVLEFRDGYEGDAPSAAYSAPSLWMIGNLDDKAEVGEATATFNAVGLQPRRLLLRWDLTSIAPGTVIERASFVLHLHSHYDIHPPGTEHGPGTVSARALTGDNEAWMGDLDEVTGNHQNAAEGVRWRRSSGAETNLPNAASVRLGDADWAEDTWTLTLDGEDPNTAGSLAIVQGWIDDPNANLGAVFYEKKTNVLYAVHASGAEMNLRPTLVIELPEPASLACLAVGSGLLIRRRGRKAC